MPNTQQLSILGEDLYYRHSLHFYVLNLAHKTNGWNFFQKITTFSPT